MKQVGLMLLGFALAAMAHHGWAAFDNKTNVTLKGTVTAFHFVNPHSVVDFDVKGDDGKVVSWQGELTSSLHLKRRGWSAVSLEAGDEITVHGNPARSGVKTMRILKLESKKNLDMDPNDGN